MNVVGLLVGVQVVCVSFLTYRTIRISKAMAKARKANKVKVVRSYKKIG